MGRKLKAGPDAAKRRKRQREAYHERKAQVMAARGITSKGVRAASGPHITAAAKNVQRAISRQLSESPEITDLVIAAHTLAKAVLG